MKLIHGQLTTAGVLGLLAAILVGAGEFLLHFDALGRFAGGSAYEFMRGIDAERTTITSLFIKPRFTICVYHCSVFRGLIEYGYTYNTFKDSILVLMICCATVMLCTIILRVPS